MRDLGGNEIPGGELGQTAAETFLLCRTARENDRARAVFPLGDRENLAGGGLSDAVAEGLKEQGITDFTLKPVACETLLSGAPSDNNFLASSIFCEME